MGTAYYIDDDLEQALDAYYRLVSVDPNDAEAHYALGLLLRAVERVDEAAEQLRRAIEIDPNHGRARKELRTLLRMSYLSNCQIM